MSGAARKDPFAAGDAGALARELFAAIDDKDADAFAGFLTEDAVFRFGNAEAVNGRAAIREAVAGFFGSIASLSHRVERLWAGAEAIACDGEVTYVRHDGSRLTVPFADVFVLHDGRIAQYLIYIDVTAL